MVWLTLLASTLLGHGGAIFDGVSYDDYLHRERLSTLGWSWSDLVESTTFDFPGQDMQFWWQGDAVQWRYPRAVCMLIMKIEYVIAGGDPRILHAFGLWWHFACACLLYELARWVLPRGYWALLAALIFAWGPNAAFAVTWTAARNALLSAFFLFATLLAYARASFSADRRPRPLHAGWLALAVVLWGAALFSREVAIILPALALGWDLSFGGVQHLRRRWWVHGLLFALAGAFVYWRVAVFATGPFPDAYFEAPDGVMYVLWLVAKFVQTTFQIMFFIPLLTLFDPVYGWTPTIIGVHIVMGVLLIGLLIAYAVLTRNVRGGWFWPFAMLAALAPILPISPMPHFAHLPIAMYAVTAALLISRLPRWRVALAWGNLLLVFCALLGHRAVYRTAFAAEELIYRDIAASTPTPRPGDQFFFINLPLSTTFVMLAMQERWDVDGLQGHGLTLSPDALWMPLDTTVEQVSPNAFVLRRPGPGFFSTRVERVFLRMTTPRAPLPVGREIDGGAFRVELLEASAIGIEAIRFTFPEPLDAPHYHFFVATPERPMARLDFGDHGLIEPDPLETESFRAQESDLLAVRDWPYELRDRYAPDWRPQSIATPGPFQTADAPTAP